ncbi:MAG: hypothetical protein U0V73_05170 [Acidimicrobiia bacterium]
MRRALMAFALVAAVAGCVPAAKPAPEQAWQPPLPQVNVPLPSSERVYPPECNPVGETTCALPFPSNHWTRPDATSATGLRLNVPDSLVSGSVLAELPASLRASAVFNASDGFSAAGPIVFELGKPVRAGSLPVDGGNAFVVYDLDTGARVPIRALVDVEAGLRGAGGTIVRAYPRSRFPWGHHLVGAVTTWLQDSAGAPETPSPGMRALLRASSRPTVDFLNAHGIGSDSLVSVTDFTVRTEADATAATAAKMQTALAQDHPVRNLSVQPNLLYGPDVSRVVTGQVLVTDFRDAAGEMDRSATATGHPEWVDFMLTIPKQAPASGAPVVVYGHGIGIFKETSIIVDNMNARHGAATLAIDQPNHGSRAAREGGFVFDLTKPAQAGRLFAMVSQSSLDQASVVKAVETSLADLDTETPVLFGNPAPADGVPDLDPSRIYYEGTSLGGVLGSTGVSLLPQYQGAMFQVTGAGITNDLADTLFWHFGFNATGTGFRGVIPKSATAGEAAFLVAATQQVIDQGDAVNYVDRLHAKGLPVLIPYALDDGTVNNRTTEAFAELARLPILGNVRRPLPFLPASSNIPDNGIVQLPTDSLAWMHATPLAPLGDLLTHASGVGGEATTAMDSWLADRIGTP